MKGFEEFWTEIEKTKSLPNTAVQQIPNALSDKIKSRLLKYSAVEAVKILLEVIEEINNGSIESIDTLLRKRL